MPKTEKKRVKQVITVAVDMSVQGYTKGKREYSSTNVSMYRLPVDAGKGPLKSMLTRSKGLVAFTRCAPSGLKKRGFNSAHTLYLTGAGYSSDFVERIWQVLATHKMCKMTNPRMTQVFVQSQQRSRSSPATAGVSEQGSTYS